MTHLEEEQEEIKKVEQIPTSTTADMNNNLDTLIDIAKEKGFEVERNKYFQAGPIDLVYKINIHPSLPPINCGFIVLLSEEGGSQDWEDSQFSLRKIEEAIIRGVRSGLDKVYLVAPNEDMAKSISGKVEWLASFGSLLRIDAISLGIFPEQQESAVITPSQKRVPQGKKSRKESKVKKRVREALLDKHNRPKGQRKRKENRR